MRKTKKCSRIFKTHANALKVVSYNHKCSKVFILGSKSKIDYTAYPGGVLVRFTTFFLANFRKNHF